MRDGPHWIPGAIAGIQGPVSYQVQVADGIVWHQHVDHIRAGEQCPRTTTTVDQETNSLDVDDTVALPDCLSPSTVSDSRPAQESAFPGHCYP